MQVQSKVKRPVGRPRADGKPQLTRKAVFAAAAKLIAQHGYTGTSLRMIAETLGVQAPSILQLFKSKDKLLIQLVQAISKISLDFHEALEKEHLPADVCLYKMLYEETKAIAAANGEFASIYYLPELRKPEFVEAQEQRNLMISWYRGCLARGVTRGLFNVRNVDLVAEQIFQLTETAIIALPTSQLGSPERHAKDTADFALRSLLAKPSRLTAIAKKAASCSLSMG